MAAMMAGVMADGNEHEVTRIADRRSRRERACAGRPPMSSGPRPVRDTLKLPGGPADLATWAL